MAVVGDWGNEFAIVRGGSGATGPQLSSLLYGSTFSSCFQFCASLMTYGMRVNTTNTSVAFSSCSTNEDGNAESFTRSATDGHTDLGNTRNAFNSYWNRWIPEMITDCLGFIFIFLLE